MLNKAQKVEIVKNLVEELKAAKAVVFSDFTGLPAKDIQSLRKDLNREGADYKVVKLTLLKRALRLAGLDVSNFNFQVPLSVSMSREDEVAAARILQAFSKKNEKLKVVSGVLGSLIID